MKNVLQRSLKKFGLQGKALRFMYMYEVTKSYGVSFDDVDK